MLKLILKLVLRQIVTKSQLWLMKCGRMSPENEKWEQSCGRETKRKFQDRLRQYVTSAGKIINT